VATQEQLRHPERFDGYIVKVKENLIQFIDEAIEYGHLLPSKRGRKTRFIADEILENQSPAEPPYKVKIPLPNNCEESSKEKDKAEPSKSLREEEKNDLKAQDQLPEVVGQRENPLVLAYPMPIAVPVPALYNMYQVPTAMPHPSVPVCLPILNSQYY